MSDLTPPAPEPSAFDAFGRPIPMHRRTHALDTLRQITNWDTEQATEVIGLVATSIERDDPYQALQTAMAKGLDLTGSYRLLAALCTTNHPVATP